MENNIHDRSEATPGHEMDRIISGSAIIWPKTKEEIWPELWGKALEIKPVGLDGKSLTMRFMKYAVAASLALIIGIGSVMYFYTKTVNTFSFQSEISLPDRSGVLLCDHSSLSYKPLLWSFSRKVRIDGEGLFMVEKGSWFDVVSEKGVTSVLGTRFIVYARNNDYEVTCLSGKVKVIEFLNQNEAVITKGQKAVLNPDGSFIITEIEIDDTDPGSDARAVDAELEKVLSGSPDVQVPTINEKKTDIIDMTVPEVQSATAKSPVENASAVKDPDLNNDQVPDNSPKVASEQIPSDNKESGLKIENRSQTEPENKLSGDKFRNSLSKEQISILEDTKMNREEKKKAFMESLSPEQRKLLEEQTKERARKAESEDTESDKKNAIKEQQERQMQEQIRSGKEIKDRNKNEKPDGKDDRPGSGNQSGSVKENAPGNGNRKGN